MPNSPTPQSQLKTPLALALAVSIALPPVIYLEGRSNKAYLDIVGVPTICYGSTTGVKLGQTKTDAECAALLRNELGRVCQRVDALVTVAMTAARLAALCSFAYNVGEGAFGKSRLLKKLNAGQTLAACAELDRWVFAGGKKVDGLVKRRALERALCEWSVDDQLIRDASNWVYQTVTAPLSITRHAALAAYASEIKLEAFKQSPVVKQLNAGAGTRACRAIPLWPTPLTTRDRQQRLIMQRMCEISQ